MLKNYNFRHWYIPERMLESLERYKNDGTIPGDFLVSILSNDLVAACGRADDENLANLPAYGAYVYNELPGPSWGSKENVLLWHEYKNK